MKTAKNDLVKTVIAIYSSDIELLAQFYKEALDLSILEQSSSFVCLAAKGVEINIVQMNTKAGKKIQAELEYTLRSETPIKCSFLVKDYEQIRQANQKFGGTLKNEDQAWEWRGMKHLDGSDPEGNIVQYRILVETR